MFNVMTLIDCYLKILFNALPDSGVKLLLWTCPVGEISAHATLYNSCVGLFNLVGSYNFLLA